jgi:hypothetical protein
VYEPNHSQKGMKCKLNIEKEEKFLKTRLYKYSPPPCLVGRNSAYRVTDWGAQPMLNPTMNLKRMFFIARTTFRIVFPPTKYIDFSLSDIIFIDSWPLCSTLRPRFTDTFFNVGIYVSSTSTCMKLLKHS